MENLLEAYRKKASEQVAKDRVKDRVMHLDLLIGYLRQTYCPLPASW
jgi:hypothetical protein